MKSDNGVQVAGLLHWHPAIFKPLVNIPILLSVMSVELWLVSVVSGPEQRWEKIGPGSRANRLSAAQAPPADQPLIPLLWVYYKLPHINYELLSEVWFIQPEGILQTMGIDILAPTLSVCSLVHNLWMILHVGYMHYSFLNCHDVSKHDVVVIPINHP